MNTRPLPGPAARLLVLGLCSVSLLGAAGCGKKGPPLAPLRPVPARVEDLTIRRLGDDVHLQFTIPSQNSDGTRPANLARVEAVAMTGQPQDPAGRALEARDFLEFGTVVGGVDVEPPPPPAPEDGPPPPPPPPDPRPAQGERATIVERLVPEAHQVFVHPEQAEYDAMIRAERGPEEDEPVARPLAIAPVVEPGRVYVVTGRTRRGQAGPLSPRLRVPLGEAPEAPPAPTLEYDESKLVVQWQPPPSRRRSLAAIVAELAAAAPPAAEPGAADPAAAVQPADVAPAPAPIESKPLFELAAPHTFNVYDGSSAAQAAADATAVTVPLPLNPQPLEALRFEDPRLAFGVERCYVVRMVEAHGSVTVESLPSPPVCVTPRDIFPPAAPQKLAAVGAEGAINLIWEPSPAPDLVGYIVLRGEAPGDKLEAVTATPIRETTYRDAAVRAGVRYVYAVVAVDNATPQNVSVESNRVEETAR